MVGSGRPVSRSFICMFLPLCVGEISESQAHLVSPRPTASSVRDDDSTRSISFLSRTLGSSNGGAGELKAALQSHVLAPSSNSHALYPLVYLCYLSLGLH